MSNSAEDSADDGGRTIDHDSLTSKDDPGAGVWPSWRERLSRQDLLPQQFAPRADGLTCPEFDTPDWMETCDATKVSPTAKEMMDAASERLVAGEKRSEGIFDAAWKLLAVGLAATGFEAARLRANAVPLPLVAMALLPNVAMVICLGLAALQGLTTSNRVGIMWQLEIEDIAEAGDNCERAKLKDYWHGAQTIDWVASRKLDDFLQAQAWLSRGIVALVVSGLIAVTVWTFTVDPEPAASAKVPPTSNSTVVRTNPP